MKRLFSLILLVGSGPSLFSQERIIREEAFLQRQERNDALPAAGWMPKRRPRAMRSGPVVLKPESPDTPYVVLTTWQDRAAFEAWVGSDDFKLAHSNPMPREAFDGEGKLEMHEVIVAAERTA